MRTINLQFFRVVLGLLAMFFAHFLGRVAARLYVQKQPARKAMTWVLRTVVALMGLLWFGGFDLIGTIFVVLVALSLAAGVYLEARPRKVEEIHLFPEDGRGTH